MREREEREKQRAGGKDDVYVAACKSERNIVSSRRGCA